MTDRKQALINLRDKVKAGKNWHFYEFDPDELLPPQWLDAFHGSLDAAKALHEAVLPEWTWIWAGYGQGHVRPREGKYSRLAKDAKCEGNPARAWLIAILEALIAKEDHTNDE